MEPISIITFKASIAGEVFDVTSNVFWSPVVKVLNANLFVNVNDKYIILYNDFYEIHINCMTGIYIDNDVFIIERENVFDGNIIETYRITKHDSRAQ